MEIKKVIVFCKNGNDAKCYYEELSDSMKIVKKIDSRLEFQTEYEIYKFMNINMRNFDGMRSHEFILSPHLLRRGKRQEIDFAIDLGRTITAIYP